MGKEISKILVTDVQEKKHQSVIINIIKLGHPDHPPSLTERWILATSPVSSCL